MNAKPLDGKNILLGISGSIAAYKAALLARLFIKAGANVKAVMTPSATAFITPLTLSTLTKHPVYTSAIDENSWNNHVELGLWADYMIVAPATANTIGKMANGIVDNMLLATYLSAKCPVMVAPAMDLDMWHHGSTVNNLNRLRSYQNMIIPVGHGELASGLVGDGRMAEPSDILDFVIAATEEQLKLSGKRFVITAGPTYEMIDPVRFVGNFSSGKMGVAIANSLADKGAKVDLILGPSKLTIDHPNIQVTRVVSAREMAKHAKKLFKKSDGAIMAAAVADFTPIKTAKSKIKKVPGQEEMQIQLKKTEDIAASLGKSKTSKQVLIGFALETNQPLKNAKSKLERKGFDFIVLNSLKDKGAGFGHDTNKITIVHKDNKTLKFKLKSKAAVAEDIVSEIQKIID